MELFFHEADGKQSAKNPKSIKKLKNQQQERRERRLRTMLRVDVKRAERLHTRVIQRTTPQVPPQLKQIKGPVIKQRVPVAPHVAPHVAPPDALTSIIQIGSSISPVKLKESSLPEDRTGQLLFVTSFNEKLYHKTGSQLLASFAEYYRDDSLVTMLVCHEGFKFVNHNPRVITYNLDSSEFLKEWSRRNAGNIPIEFGCTGTKKSNPRLFANKFNIQMSRWFRKIASLEYAYRKLREKYRGICWIDCDCTFQQHLSSSLLFGTLGKKSVGYHLGLRRQLCQTGVET